ncbi:MAG: aminoacyl-histidine dipeptidase [Anaerolineales bacterium]|nr:aminoacyl-histidine dipeptidase [Anaerolineales bacterium]
MNPTELILSNFEKVSSIPRGSKNEAAIRNWLIKWAAEHNCTSKTDVAGNLVIYAPASAGYEDRPTLILQGHMDMVCQKTLESTHDFTKDPIQLIRDGDWIRANGTTLGADNGIGIALMMSLVEDESVKHPRLELLLTVEEEFGIVGADNLDPSLISGKTMINLDSETEGVFTVGCAGGGSVYITQPIIWEAPIAGETAFELKVSGLLGGHSGEDIHKHRANANKLIGRLLDGILRNVQIRLSEIKGGTARNAIPREAKAVFTCLLDQVETLREISSVLFQIIRREHTRTEPGLVISLMEAGEEPVRLASLIDSQKIACLLSALPNGVSAFSADTPGSVETSNNIGVMETKEVGFEIISNHRSSVLTRLEESIARVEALAWLAGAKTEQTKLFPPWQPDIESRLLQQSLRVYRATFEKEPVVMVCHGGLECGIISSRCGGIDAISIGPDMQHLHSPDERLYVPSLSRVWDFLCRLLV